MAKVRVPGGSRVITGSNSGTTALFTYWSFSDNGGQFPDAPRGKPYINLDEFGTPGAVGGYVQELSIMVAKGTGRTIADFTIKQ